MAGCVRFFGRVRMKTADGLYELKAKHCYYNKHRICLMLHEVMQAFMNIPVDPVLSLDMNKIFTVLPLGAVL